MVQTAIQLYTLDDFDVSEPTKIYIASETAVDGVEMQYTGSPSQATIDALEETGLTVAGLTVGMNHLEESDDEINQACDILGCDTVILGYLEETYFDSPDATRETAQILSEYGRQFQKRGRQFLFHTHRHEFAPLDDGTHFDLLVEEIDNTVEFEFDLGWIGVSGVDPYVLLEEVGSQVTAVHLKDMDFETETFVNLGEGDLDLDRAVKTAIGQDVDWLVYEHEDPDDPVESVVTGASKLEQFKQLRPTK
jgi:sugar phosphate isomerase/epimerase